ncbi:hypothetical protein FOQG_19645 [Fusarium oxysporum f. sp. raphani 54005]|uniref:Uncharacterized protein n=1 Tax=Fusarium oxysporum f. sp. raphani 54005 TaxID=1089458 RepID=X0B9T7_FUSOX|nr:hypothetical protein FOQG_19645 [Fusarium oxysporum f. sp. raphani 54005]
MIELLSASWIRSAPPFSSIERSRCSLRSMSGRDRNQFMGRSAITTQQLRRTIEVVSTYMVYSGWRAIWSYLP